MSGMQKRRMTNASWTYLQYQLLSQLIFITFLVFIICLRCRHHATLWRSWIQDASFRNSAIFLQRWKLMSLGLQIRGRNGGSSFLLPGALCFEIESARLCLNSLQVQHMQITLKIRTCSLRASCAFLLLFLVLSSGQRLPCPVHQLQ